jgi:acetyltransferase-like isoleucine patch superfamily enzyme
METKNILLSICIPTFNRAKYLDKCLSTLCSQAKPYENLIQFIVSDNASTDNTFEIVKKYIDQSFQIEYHISSENIGADRNVELCYSLAKGKYFWCFGDDDILLDNKLKVVMGLIQTRDYGMIYCNNYWFENDFQKEFPFQLLENNVIVFKSKYDFLIKVNYWVTFISACIIQKHAIQNKIDSKKYIGSSLNHVQWNLLAACNKYENIYIEEYVIACKGGNSGGYKLFEVFGKNFDIILRDLERDMILPKGIKYDIQCKLLKEFFPMFISTKNEFFERESTLFVMFKTFWKYKNFWKYNFYFFFKKKREKIAQILNDLKMNFRKIILKVLADIFYRIINSEYYQKKVKIKMNNDEINFKNSFASFGENSTLPSKKLIKNPQFIKIGKNFRASYNLRIEAWDEYFHEKFIPEVNIGDNVTINSDVHIGCIGRVEIGNNVLIASRVYISDHSHGNTDIESLQIPPVYRPLITKGEMIIGDNVWIGEGAIILPGVSIGHNSLVAANSVVTESVQPFSVVAGVPAKVITPV